MKMFVTYVKPTIECIRCGIVVEADPMSINQWCHSTDEVHRIIAPRMPDIPVGWSSDRWKGNQRDLCCTSWTA